MPLGIDYKEGEEFVNIFSGILEGVLKIKKTFRTFSVPWFPPVVGFN
jgi:hypothetical protein